MIGEAEEVINEVLDAYSVWKKGGGTREEFLRAISVIGGIYVPQFYDVEYNEDETISSFQPRNPCTPPKVRKRIIKDLDKSYYPQEMIVPFTGIVHDRIMLELFRGCIRGCRFCQAGFIYRPVREKTAAKLLKTAENLQKNTGYEEISLASLSTSDYTQLKVLTDGLIKEMEPKRVSLSLPSLRVDSFSLDLMERVQRVRKSGRLLHRGGKPTAKGCN